SSSPRTSSGTFTYAGTPLTITTLTPPNGELLVPGQTYTITVAPQTDFSGASSASVVPSGSPASTGAPVTFTNLPAASVNGPFYTLTGKSTKTNVSKTINPQTLTAGSNTINIPLGSGSSNC